MNGPDHYRIAEALLHWQELAHLSEQDPETGLVTPFYPDTQDLEGDGTEERTGRNALAAAQVHATLALAAATIDAAAHPNQNQIDYLGQWWKAQDA